MVDNLRTHEEIVCVWHVATDPEELHEIMELAMNIPTYLTMTSQRRGSRVYRYGFGTVTGASTRTTLPSSIRSSRAL